VGDLSGVYLDVLKDRLYADAPASLSRRSAQTVLSAILGVLVRILAPILSFTAEEVWLFMPEALRDAKSVHLSNWPTLEFAEDLGGLETAYAAVLSVREGVTKALEEARNAKVIGKSQEAAVSVTAPADVVTELEARGSTALAELFIVASVDVKVGDEAAVVIVAAQGEKCPRCWNLRELGTDHAHPEVCARCAGVLSGLE
jgi:isoleucyl-tRNA synthetase